MSNLEYHKGSFYVYNPMFYQAGYCSGCEIFRQHETDGWYEECLLCGCERHVSNLVNINTGAQINTNEPTETEQQSYTDVQISPVK